MLSTYWILKDINIETETFHSIYSQIARDTTSLKEYVSNSTKDKL